MLMEVDGIKFARTVPHLSANPTLPAEPAPKLGQHTRPILQDLLGYSAPKSTRWPPRTSSRSSTPEGLRPGEWVSPGRFHNSAIRL